MLFSIMNEVAFNNYSTYEEIGAVAMKNIVLEENTCYETVSKKDSEKHEGRSPVNNNNYSSNSKRSICILVTAIIIIMALILTCACCVFTLAEVFKLKSEITYIKQISPAENSSEIYELSQAIDQLNKTIKNHAKQLNSSINIHHQFSQEIENESQQLNSSINRFHHQLSREIENESQQLNSLINMIHHQLNQEIENESQQLNSSINMFHHQLSQEIENESQQLNSSINTINQKCLVLEGNTQQLINSLGSPGEYQSYPAASCVAVLLYDPSFPSGHYWVRSSTGSAVRVYCDMIRSCGNITGGWMKVAELDTTNSSTQCPSGLRQRTDSNVRTCTQNSNSGGCSSVTLFTSNIHYSKVCGKIKAYQFGSTDAFGTGTDNIDRDYVDGVSLTHGSPRQHIWTFAAARDETTYNSRSKCPCTNINTTKSATPPPEFVGNDYFCDTGSSDFSSSIFYSDDPLWDGAGCGPLNTCCSFNNPPWFYKQLRRPITDDIEMRVCRSHSSGDEDIGIEMFDIYIQ